jgi:signal transduction histidine kinase
MARSRAFEAAAIPGNEGCNVATKPGRRAARQPPLTVIVNVAPVRNTEGDIIGAVHSWVDTTEQRLDRALQVAIAPARARRGGRDRTELSFDRDGNVAQANGALLKMLDFSDDDLPRAGSIWLPRHRLSIARSTLRHSLSRDGRCLRHTKNSSAATGTVSVVVGYARVPPAPTNTWLRADVTERKLLEQQLRQQPTSCCSRTGKDEFLAMLAHELRNPLAPLRNALYLLEADKQRRWSTVDSVLPTMRRQIDQLVRMVDDLLDAARISQNKILVEKSVVDLKPILRAAIETVQPLISARGHA